MDKRIVLGANRFQKLSQVEVDRVLYTALELGIRQIDTAPTYATSEEKIGHFLARNHGAFEVRTKIFRDASQVSLSLAQLSIEKSLKRLRVNQINTLYLHGTHLGQNHSDIQSYLQQCESKKIVGRIGWCGNLSESTCLETDFYKSLMVRLNPWDEVIETRKDLLGKIDITGMNIFANGFWNYQEWGRIRAFTAAHFRHEFNPAPSYYLDHPRKKEFEKYHDFKKLLFFALSKKYLTDVVIGTTRESHLRSIVEWVRQFDMGPEARFLH